MRSFIFWNFLSCKWSAARIHTGTLDHFHHYGREIILLYPSTNYVNEKKKKTPNTFHIILYISFVKLHQPQSCNFLVLTFHLRRHASYFGPWLLLCSIAIVKQVNSNSDSLPTVFHYEAWRLNTNWYRTQKFPAHYPVCARNTNQPTRRTFNRCKLWGNLLEQAGLPVPYSFLLTRCSQTQRTVLGVNQKVIENADPTVSTVCLCFPSSISFPFHAASHLCSFLLPAPLHLFSPRSPLPCSLHAV